jgi:8-oxo-dGTP pyrophosphatase MutT (NUDIX family)
VSRVAAALNDWVALDDAQEELRRAFLEHALQNVHPDDRHCLPDHVTASALVVDESRAAVLLGLHRKVGLWLQFGGHVERGDPALSDAALREAREESGIELTLRSTTPVRLDVHAAPCSPNARHHLDVQYAAVALDRATPTVSPESLDVRWFSVRELPPDTDDAVRRLVAACIA